MAKRVLTRHTIIPPVSFEISTTTGGPNDVKPLDFSLPDDFVGNIARSRPVLTYLISPRSDDVVLGIWINPQDPNLVQSEEVSRWIWPKGPRHAQALSSTPSVGRARYRGGKNDLFFKVWKGRVRVQSVVLWYQRRITVPPQG